MCAFSNVLCVWLHLLTERVCSNGFLINNIKLVKNNKAIIKGLCLELKMGKKQPKWTFSGIQRWQHCFLWVWKTKDKGKVMGTDKSWAAPEELQGFNCVSKRSIYSQSHVDIYRSLYRPLLSGSELSVTSVVKHIPYSRRRWYERESSGLLREARRWESMAEGFKTRI